MDGFIDFSHTGLAFFSACTMKRPSSPRCAQNPDRSPLGVDLIFNALPFGCLWYTEPDDAIEDAKFHRRSNHPGIRSRVVKVAPLSSFRRCRRGLAIARVLRLRRFGSLAILTFG
jgi:hypothetical protein